MIAITGATGKTGRAVTKTLVRKGANVRTLVHRETRLDATAALGPLEVSLGDLTDSASLQRAFAGSSSVYHICPNMRADEFEIGERVIEACRRVGVERLVYHSVLHPQIKAMPHHWNKLRVEESLIESGLDFTILQPAAYMQNIQQQWGCVLETGVYEVPYRAETRIALVDLRDVAEVAARVLIEVGHHDSAIYELCGPSVPSQLEVAGAMSRVTDRTILVREADRKAWRQQAEAAGLGEYAVASLLAMFEHYEQFGFSGNRRVLEALLGSGEQTVGIVRITRKKGR